MCCTFATMPMFEACQTQAEKKCGRERQGPNLCAHNCHLCDTLTKYDRDGFMHPNVRCHDCGHAWVFMRLHYNGSLPQCDCCGSVINTCSHCMERIGVRNYLIYRERRYWCRKCWVGWLEDKFRETCPQKVVTLNVAIDHELEDSLVVTCTGLDGSKVMKTAKMNINSSRVGDIREKLRCEFGHEELRLLPDGWFYSLREFEAWASFYEGGILPMRSRERAYGMMRHALQDDKHIDILTGTRRTGKACGRRLRNSPNRSIYALLMRCC